MMMKLSKRTWWIVAGAGVSILLVLGGWYRSTNGSGVFRTAEIQRGDLTAVISATGTVEPEEVIDVGAQVAGKIVNFGKDKTGKTVDYGSAVEAGMVLAQIDDALYAAEAAQARAQLDQAKAGLKRAEADLGQLKAKLFQAERDWQRAKRLGPSEALSQSDFDTAQSNFEIARANVAVGQAAIVQSKDGVAQAAASLRRAEQNLSYCTIRSPVRGVIIDRRVNIGQTVVASLNAPSLFLLAKDLKRMQVWVAVNEADIGNIRPGQPVAFTADAYPGQTFQGEVGKVRLNATMTQNVVTYTVEVNTDNSDGRLLPYLTANVKFLVSERKGVLLAPNASLRWTPTQEQVAPQFRGVGQAAEGDKTVGGEGKTRRVLWLPKGNRVKPLAVFAGVTDGAQTEVQGEGLKEGLQVVVGEEEKESGKSAESSSPFTPQIFRGGPGGRR